MKPDSPCIGICKMDPATGWCAGCHRTLDEIAAWLTLGDAAKAAVCNDLPARRAATFPAGAPRSQRAKHCSRCHAEFLCGPAPDTGRCWCDDLPPAWPLSAATGDCLCPDCLAVAVR